MCLLEVGQKLKTWIKYREQYYTSKFVIFCFKMLLIQRMILCRKIVLKPVHNDDSKGESRNATIIEYKKQNV